MSEVSIERLAAYHDRELGLEDTSGLRRALADDAEARAILDAFDQIDDAVRESFAEELNTPVSFALASSVRAGFAARKRRAVGTTILRWAMPVAAAIAIMVFGNNLMEQRIAGALAEREVEIAALTDRAVQNALETALSGAAFSMVDDKLAGVVSITPVRTYQSETKHWCREFVEEVVVDNQHTTRFGLACRENAGGWRRVETRLPGSMPPPVGQSL
jgi:surface antigen